MATKGQTINYATLSASPYGSYVMMDNDTGSYQDGYFYTSSPSIVIVSYLSHSWALVGNASRCNVYRSSYDFDTGAWTSESQVISNTYDSTESTANRTKYVYDSARYLMSKRIDRWRIDMSSKGHKIVTAMPYGLIGVWANNSNTTNSPQSFKDVDSSADGMGMRFYNNYYIGKQICGLGNLAKTGKERFIYVYGTFAQNDAGAIAYFNPTSNRGRTIYGADEHAVFPKV